jgi:hypothetical protein
MWREREVEGEGQETDESWGCGEERRKEMEDGIGKQRSELKGGSARRGGGRVREEEEGRKKLPRSNLISYKALQHTSPGMYKILFQEISRANFSLKSKKDQHRNLTRLGLIFRYF